MQEASEQSLLAKARSIAVQALARIEKVFPGKETPPRDEPPIPICATVGVEAMSEFYKSYWTPPAGKSVTLWNPSFRRPIYESEPAPWEAEGLPSGWHLIGSLV